ncbi:hypothetical protein D5086_030047, partial [Populus alba]
KPGAGLQNQLYAHLCVPNSTLLEYRQLEGREGFLRPDILDRVWNCGLGREFPEWTSNAANLQIKLPRPRPRCFNEVQRAALTEIADVTRAEYAYDTSECTSFAKKHMYRENYMSALFSCEKMYVPVFDKERRHFYLFVLHMKKQVVEIWDSLAKSSGSSVDKRLPNMVSASTLRATLYDCGVYVIKFMLAPEEVTQPDFVFDSDTERLDVVLGLLDGDGVEVPESHDQEFEEQNSVFGPQAYQFLDSDELAIQMHLRFKLFMGLRLLLGEFDGLNLGINKRGIDLENLPYPHLCVPNSTLLEYRQLDGRRGFSRPDIVNRAWQNGFSEWTSNAADLQILVLPPGPQVYNEVQRAALTEIADVTRASVQLVMQMRRCKALCMLVSNYICTQGKANADDPSKCISFAKKHRIKENYMSDLLCCEKAFVPVFDNERRHFFLFVLQLKRQVVEIWDSLAASRQSDWVDRRLHNLLVSLDALFKDDIDQNYQKVWSFTDFRVERPSNVPQQQNGHDCGVYVIKFMLAPEEVPNPDFVFNRENERLEVVLGLLASDVNSCRNDLASKAKAYYEQRNSMLIKSDVNGDYCTWEICIIGTDIKWEYGKQSSGCTFLWVVEISG